MPMPVYVAAAALWALALIVGRATGFEVSLPIPLDYGLFALAVGVRSGWFQRRYPRLRPLGVVAEAVFLVDAAVNGAVPVSYAVQGFNNPLQDAAFLAFDRALGFDYPAFMAWITRFPRVYFVLGQIYGQFGQVAFALFISGLVVRRQEQIGARFFTAFLIAIMLTAIISGLFPAEGAVTLLDPQVAARAYGATPIAELHALRAGLMHAMPATPAGMISFPSMHVGAALLILFYARKSPILFVVFAPIALVFIFTALSHGAHYIADMVAAVPTAAAALLLTGALFRLRLTLPLVARTGVRA